MRSIWFGPVGFPGSFTHCSTTLHDTVYSVFHCSSSAVGCFWKDGVWRGGLRSLSYCFRPSPPGFYICSPICARKCQREVLFRAQGPLAAQVPRKPKNTCEVTASCFCLWSHWIPSAITDFPHRTSFPHQLLICWPCKCSQPDMQTAIRRINTSSFPKEQK